MCGIAGIYNINGHPVDVEILCRMRNLQKHRGPDDQGMSLFSFSRAKSLLLDDRGSISPVGKFEGGIGFNRLSILDLSENGHQPMTSRNGSILLAFNGEIYNAPGYRSELSAAGFRFRSTTDTEVILYLYEYYGFLGMLERLNGMFAICLVDLNSQEIYLVRDRMGIKPLYWFASNGTFLFSSEVKSFLCHPGFRAELNFERLDEYFTFRYCAGDGFLLAGVHPLQPGHWIRIHPGGWKIHKYWEIPDSSESDLSFSSALEMVEQKLQRSVQMQLLSDVKLGCQLSGGIDSSLVSMFASTHERSEMEGFSIVFDDPKFSEERWIETAASKANFRIHKYVLGSDYFLDHLEAATWHMDQPLSTPNAVGIFCLAERARSIITVFLSGEGADELFGGYTRFLYAMLLPKVHSWLPLLNRLPYWGTRISNKFAHLENSDEVGWFILQSAFQTRDALLRLRPEADLDRVLSQRRAIFEEGKRDFVSNCFKYELQTYLVDLLIRQDKMTMAHSMENRVPFLDHELVTLVRSLSPHHLVQTNFQTSQMAMRNTKLLLKKLALRYFDPDFVYRKKSGFGLPLEAYFVHPRFRDLMQDKLLPGMRNRGIVQTDVVEGWWHNFNSNGNRQVESLWICVAFEIWAQQYLDSSPCI